MKTIFTAIFILLMIFNQEYLFSQRNSFELGIRFIKLSNSYREAGYYDKAIEYIEKGKILVGNSDYWLAVAKEYYGYIMRDIGRSKNDLNEKKLFYQNAIDSFNEALAIYKRIIFQPDGSPIPIEALLRSMNELVDEIEGNKLLMAQSLNSNTYNAIAGEKSLNFDRQKLKNLPADIPENTKSLSLANNRFNQFPEGITRFKDLAYLDLSNNRIKNLPASISGLKELHYLDLANNRIAQLSPEIGKLEKLTELNLENNRLKDLPATICNLKNLKILNLRNNKIPFEKISNIIKCLPECNVLIDEYILKPRQNQEIQMLEETQ